MSELYLYDHSIFRYGSRARDFNQPLIISKKIVTEKQISRRGARRYALEESGFYGRNEDRLVLILDSLDFEEVIHQPEGWSKNDTTTDFKFVFKGRVTQEELEMALILLPKFGVNAPEKLTLEETDELPV